MVYCWPFMADLFEEYSKWRCIRVYLMSRALCHPIMELHKIKYGPIYLQHQRSLTSTNAQNCKICITILRAKDVQTRFFFLRSFAHLFKLLAGYIPSCSHMYWCRWHNIKIHFKLSKQWKFWPKFLSGS